MTNREKFLTLVNGVQSDTVARVSERRRNRTMLRESQGIALKVLMKLNSPGWSQRRLAAEMGVSPQQVTKIVSGKENLTLETQTRLQEILDIPILASYYENKAEVLATVVGEMIRKEFSFSLIRPSLVVYEMSQSVGKVINISQNSFTYQDAANG